MGANASTAVPLYASGQVLDAARLNLTNAGIPVFSGTATRDAAFGGSGEKVLAEGQFAYLEDTNAVQYYDSAAWQAVGVTPGLVCVKAETAFSALTITADNVFTSDYTNYRIIIRYQGSTGSDFLMQFRAATVDTATGYNAQSLAASSTTVTGSRTASGTTFSIGFDSSGVTSSIILELGGVQLAEPTTIQSLNARNASALTTPTTNLIFGNQSASTAFDGIKFTGTSGTFTGSYTIYGYSKTV